MRINKEKLLITAVSGMFLCEILIKTFTYNPKIQLVNAKNIYSKTYNVSNDVKGEVAPVQQDMDMPVIDESELDILSRLIYAEAGSEVCSSEMRYLVGAVALNRVKSNEFPDTLREVIYQDEPLQYACVEDGNIEKQPTEECIRIAYALLANGTDIPETVVFQSEFKQGSGVYKQIDNMYFCYR